VRVKWDPTTFASLYYFEFSDDGAVWTVVAPQNLPPDSTVFSRQYEGGFVTTPMESLSKEQAKTRYIRMVAEKSCTTSASVAVASLEVYGHGDLFVRPEDR
jgi:hypothetical protein